MRILSFIMLLALPGFGQQAFNDAVTIRDKFTSGAPVWSFKRDNPSVAGLCNVLRKYMRVTSDQNEAQVLNYFSGNPFFGDQIKTLAAGGMGVASVPSQASLLRQAGNMDVTNFADGLAKFLVKRMKEELSISFFEAFEKELKKQKDLQLLFPSTYTILAAASEEIYQYQRYLAALREAFAYDLDELLNHTYEWSISPDKDLVLLNVLRKNEKVHNTVKLALYVGRQLDSGQHPGDLLSDLTKNSDISWAAIEPNLLAYVQAADQFSQSLRSVEPGRYWLSQSEVQRFSDPAIARLYLGLLYESLPNDLVVGADNVKAKIMELNLESRLRDAQTILMDLAREFADTEKAIAAIAKDPANAKGSDYFKAARIAISAVERLNNTKWFPQINPADLKEVSFYADHGSFLVADIESRAYSAGIFEAYTILNHATKASEDSTKALPALNAFLKYGTFAAAVATAENSQDVSDAIEAAVLPAGSARIKREVAWNISLNAYLGGFYGEERIYIDGTSQWKNVTGVWAPVGIAVSRSIGLWNTRWSISVFGSIIDVGALASYRLDPGNDVETSPEITLANIISPGGFLVIGLPKIPVSIGYGYQMTPQLRQVAPGSSITLNDHTDRLSGFIAVDIPLANFWSKPRK